MKEYMNEQVTVRKEFLLAAVGLPFGGMNPQRKKAPLAYKFILRVNTTQEHKDKQHDVARKIGFGKHFPFTVITKEHKLTANPSPTPSQ